LHALNCFFYIRCDLCFADFFRIYICTYVQLIAWKDGNSSLLVEPREFDCLEKVSKLNENAASVHDLYPDGTTTCGSRSIWDDMIVSSARATIQKELRDAIRSMELTSDTNVVASPH
jgi:hypothetical protein